MEQGRAKTGIGPRIKLKAWARRPTRHPCSQAVAAPVCYEYDSCLPLFHMG